MNPRRVHHVREPRRVQRRRVKGWRAPEGAVYVGRGAFHGFTP